MQDTSGRPYHHGDLKRALIQTAQTMLREEKGWQFTLREVARRAGVSHAAPYKHFADKAALLATLAAGGFVRLAEALAVARENSGRSARQEFVEVANAYMSFGKANPSLYRLMFSADVDKESHRELQDCADGAFAIILDLLERGQERGAFKAQPVRGQAAACWAMVHGLTMLAIDGQLLPEKVGVKPFDAALQCLLTGLQA